VTARIETEAAAREERNAALIAALREKPPEDATADEDFDLINDAERGRWIGVVGAEGLAELSYRLVGGRVVLLTTWVHPAHRRQPVVAALILRVLDAIRATGRTITVVCPVVGEFIARNPRYRDLIDATHPGPGAPAHDVPGAPETDA
jgi:predicted GNAT family acetyltransferase